MLDIDNDPLKSALANLGARLSEQTTIIRLYTRESDSTFPKLTITPSLGLNAYFSPSENTIRLEVGIWIGFFLALRGLRSLESSLRDKVEQEKQAPLLVLDSNGAGQRTSCIRDSLQVDQLPISEAEFLALINNLELMSGSQIPDQRAKWLELDFAVSFIALHEIAHFVLKHHLKGPAEQISGESLADVKELSADSFALRLLIKYLLSNIGTKDAIKDCVKIMAIARAVTFAMYVHGASESIGSIAPNCVHPPVHQRLLNLTLAMIHGVGQFECFPTFIRGYYGIAAADAAKLWDGTGWPKVEETAYALARRNDADVTAIVKKFVLQHSDSKSLQNDASLGDETISPPNVWYPASYGDFILSEFVGRHIGDAVTIAIVRNFDRFIVVYPRDTLLNYCLDLCSEQVKKAAFFDGIENVAEGRISMIVFVQPEVFAWFGLQPSLEKFRLRRRIAYRGEDNAARLSWGSTTYWRL